MWGFKGLGRRSCLNQKLVLDTSTKTPRRQYLEVPCLFA